MTDETTTTKKPGLSPIEVGAGAGAAVITAFASSYLGTAGTLTGAAVASVLGTVSTSVLRNSAQTSAQRLKDKTTRLRETRVQQTGVADVRPVESEDIDPYGTQLFGAPDWIDPETRADVPSTTGTRTTGAHPDRTGAHPDRTERLGTSAGEVWPNGTSPLGSGSEPGSAWGAPTEQIEGSGTGPNGTGVGGPEGPSRPGTGVGGPGGPSRPGTARGLGGPSRPGTASGPGRSGTTAGSSGPGTAGGPGSSRPSVGTAPGRRVRPRWVVLGAGAVAAFAVAMGAITGIEAAAGKPLSGLAGQESGGGTTLGRATGSDGGSSSGTTPTPTPTPTTSGGAGSTGTAPASPGATATSPSGGGRSATAPAPAATAPTPVPSATQPAPTQAPTGSPNPLTFRTP
jgi:hypothetical protein